MSPRHSGLQRQTRGLPAAVWAGLVGLASGGFLAARLFVGGAIGMSDQGDGVRLLCSLGLRQGNPYNTSTTNYVYLTWYEHQWYGETCGATGSGESYDSSQLWILSVARWLTSVLGMPGELDLRAVGIVFCVIVAVAMGLLFLVLPGSLVARLLAVLAVMLVVADGAFAGYFVSAYSEPAALIGVLALVLAAFVFWRAERATWWAAALVGAACLFTITAKTQAASFLFTVIPLILWRHTFGNSVRARLARRRQRGASVMRRHRLAAAVLSRWPALAISVVLIAATSAYLGAQPERFQVQNSYAAVFIEMLPHSPNPEQDLTRLGLDPDLVSSSGVPINAPGSASQELSFVGFEDKTSPLQTTLIYLRQPFRLIGMMGRGLTGMGVLRADYIYSYPTSAGNPPNSQECRICVLQWTWKTVFGAVGFLIFLATVAAIAICWRLAVIARDRRRAAVGAVGLLLATSSIVQFWVVMLTEGASDLIKHMFLANFMTALLLVVAGYSFYLLRTGKPAPVRPENVRPETTVGQM